MPKPRHRAARPASRPLFITLLLVTPLAFAFGLVAVTHFTQGAAGDQGVRTLANANRTGPSSRGPTSAKSQPGHKPDDGRTGGAPSDTNKNNDNNNTHRKKNHNENKLNEPVNPPNQQPNPNCTLKVPANPLSAAGLATPYVLSGTDPGGACHEANTDQSAFVEATILDPATGKLSVYRPLVIDRGTAPAAPPVMPTLPTGAVVGIWFGFNGDTLTLRGNDNSLSDGKCVNGLGDSLFGQFAYCNAPALFTAANTAIAGKQLVVPPQGKGKDGMPCPTVRDFSLVDQDQSDNVTTTYLATADGRTAQAGAGNQARLGTTTALTNGSDNGLLDAFVDPALGCTPFTAPDLTNNGAPSTSLALNELQAAAHQAQPVALVPPSDPMALVDDHPSVPKANLYRAGVDQPPVNVAADTNKAYCTNISMVGRQRLAADKGLFSHAPSPDPAVANLFEFLTQRLGKSIQQLGCNQN